MSKISVVVPIYNAGNGNKLDKCIQSILNQTFKDIELVLVNDGSTDNSLDICKHYQNLDKRIMIIDKNNEGCIASRRKGVEASKSELVMFVDADDWIDSKTTETLYKESMESRAEITVCNMYKVVGKGMIIKRKNKSVYFREDKIFNKAEIMRDLVPAYFYGHPFPSSLCAKLYEKELLLNSGKYLERIRFLGEDLFYNLEMFVKANRVKLIDKPMYYYRAGGFTSRYMPYLFDDMVNGYQIQKEVIEEYYQASLLKQYNGISIMLLNTLKTCLYNVFTGKFSESEIKGLISTYVSNHCVKECLSNEGAKRYFSEEYLAAIRNKDIKYLYDIGEQMYKKRKIKRTLVNLLSKLSVV